MGNCESSSIFKLKFKDQSSDFRITPNSVSSDEDAGELFMNTLSAHIEVKSPETIDKVRKYFSIGRKFSNYQKHDFKENAELLTFKENCNQFDCNPFSVPADHFKLDLLTDSGTGRLTEE